MKKGMTTIGKQPLIVEMTKNEFWGRVDINNNLIVDSAPSLETLKKKIKKAINEIENIEVENFEVSFDLTSFFEQYSFLNISDIARRTNISPLMMRQYSSGIKFPSEERVKEIESAIQQIGKELSRVKLHKRDKEYA
ncbi:MAG TPA: hypothetical protein VGQ09_21210 [Chitinophagaceae bacterium]|jgi:hypothetical protein|nr:hypothetical protein [Chitinophagaceae bacterium]